mmetsp:Transcript_39966/g.76435  ORF Transcript_39966/g.76435 Transcript_39966/m.76435 type:complete len:302 (-) Transcript_39966:1907-2812(-)
MSTKFSQVPLGVMIALEIHCDTGLCIYRMERCFRFLHYITFNLALQVVLMKITYGEAIREVDMAKRLHDPATTLHDAIAVHAGSGNLVNPPCTSSAHRAGVVSLETVLGGFTKAMMNKLLAQHMGNYSAVQPFPHVVIDNFFPEEFAQAISDEFSDNQREVIDAECQSKKTGRGVSTWMMGVHCPTTGKDRGKSGVSNPDFMQVHTTLAFMVLRSPQFVMFLQRLTGISHLIPDPTYRGSGLHMTRPGGYIQVNCALNFTCATTCTFELTSGHGLMLILRVPCCEVLFSGFRRINFVYVGK